MTSINVYNLSPLCKVTCVIVFYMFIKHLYLSIKHKSLCYLCHFFYELLLISCFVLSCVFITMGTASIVVNVLI